MSKILRLIFVVNLCGCGNPESVLNNKIELNGNTINYFGTEIILGSENTLSEKIWKKEVYDGPSWEAENKLTFRNKNGVFDTYKGKIYDISCYFDPQIIISLNINGVEFKSSTERNNIKELLKNNENNFIIIEDTDSRLSFSLDGITRSSLWYQHNNSDGKEYIAWISFYVASYDYQYTKSEF